MSLLRRMVDGVIGTSRQLTAAGSYRKALKYNRRAIKLVNRMVRNDPYPFAALINQPTLARLHYDQAGILHQLGAGEQAIAAAKFAEYLYTDIDPTQGDPGSVEATLREFRKQGMHRLTEFEEHIGNAANARSYLALMLALYRGTTSADTVEVLGSNAVRTYEELARVSRTYGPEDLRRVVAQVTQAQQLLRR
jgi:tetratricopeptide (TPR) repeat protein